MNRPVVGGEACDFNRAMGIASNGFGHTPQYTSGYALEDGQKPRRSDCTLAQIGSLNGRKRLALYRKFRRAGSGGDRGQRRDLR